MKPLALLALLLTLGGAGGAGGAAGAQEEPLQWFAKLPDIAQFSLEFARRFEHPPVLLRGASKPDTKLFAGAKLTLDASTAELVLREAPFRETLSTLESEPIVDFVAFEPEGGEPYVLVYFADRSRPDGQDPNPASAVRRFQVALLQAFDAKFKRRSSP